MLKSLEGHLTLVNSLVAKPGTLAAISLSLAFTLARLSKPTTGVALLKFLPSAVPIFGPFLVYLSSFWPNFPRSDKVQIEKSPILIFFLSFAPNNARIFPVF